MLVQIGPTMRYHCKTQQGGRGYKLCPAGLRQRSSVGAHLARDGQRSAHFQQVARTDDVAVVACVLLQLAIGPVRPAHASDPDAEVSGRDDRRVDALGAADLSCFDCEHPEHI